IPIDMTDMSFSVEDSDMPFKSFAFGSYSQTFRFLMNKNSWIFLREKKRFHRDAHKFLEDGIDESGQSIVEWLRVRGYHDVFVYGWVIPFCAAVWSSPA